MGRITPTFIFFKMVKTTNQMRKKWIFSDAICQFVAREAFAHDESWTLGVNAACWMVDPVAGMIIDSCGSFPKIPCV